MIIVSVILILFLIAADQITKLLVINKIDLGEVINVIKFGDTEIFSLTHIRNTGAAWGSFSSKTAALTVVTLLLVAAMLVLLYVKPVQKKVFDRPLSKLETVSFSMIIAGGLGNIIDRIRLKEVVDFIKADFIDFPIFNFADICVVVGCILFVLDIVICDILKREKKTDKTEIPEKNDG